jgi:hypothetical protein
MLAWKARYGLIVRGVIERNLLSITIVIVNCVRTLASIRYPI